MSVTEKDVSILIRRLGFDEVIARALDPLNNDQPWSTKDKAEPDRPFFSSLAAAERGDLYTAGQARRLLAERRTPARGGKVRA